MAYFLKKLVFCRKYTIILFGLNLLLTAEPIAEANADDR